MSDDRGDVEDVFANLQAIYTADCSKLKGAVTVGRVSSEIAWALASVTSAAERDSRRKLSEVRVGMSAARAVALALATTVPLRVTAAAIRAASGKISAYRAELDTQYVVPAAAAARKKRGRRSSGGPGGFNITGGVK